MNKIHDGGRKSIGQQEIRNVFSQTERENPSRSNKCRASWLARTRRDNKNKRLCHATTSIVYIVSRGPTSFVFPALSLPPPPVTPHTSHMCSDPGTKAASFEGGSETKRVPTNTACNRVNCAAYAFISLFRDNLLIVSTKRDNPLVGRPGRFFGSREGDPGP